MGIVNSRNVVKVLAATKTFYKSPFGKSQHLNAPGKPIVICNRLARICILCGPIKRESLSTGIKMPYVKKFRSFNPHNTFLIPKYLIGSLTF